jgi:hypothetical protein
MNAGQRHRDTQNALRAARHAVVDDLLISRSARAFVYPRLRLESIR